MEKIDIERLKQDADNFKIEENNSYLVSYPEFIKYFSRLDIIEKHHFIIGTHFVYGWMPKVLQIKNTPFEEIIAILNKAKVGEPLEVRELDALKACINNSLVGTSKLLHFINPEQYAIWDSKIFRYVTGKKSPYNIGYTDESPNMNIKQDFYGIRAKITQSTERSTDYDFSERLN